MARRKQEKLSPNRQEKQEMWWTQHCEKENKELEQVRRKKGKDRRQKCKPLGGRRRRQSGTSMVRQWRSDAKQALNHLGKNH